ncbi:MAG: hypothetical protein ACRDBA_16870 [Clostridium sp.]
MNIFKLAVSIIYFIIGIGLIIISKFLPDKYYLKMRRNYRVLNSYKIIKLGRILSLFSGICWLIISYLFYKDINIIIVLWINIGGLALYNIKSYSYIEKHSV